MQRMRIKQSCLLELGLGTPKPPNHTAIREHDGTKGKGMMVSIFRLKSHKIHSGDTCRDFDQKTACLVNVGLLRIILHRGGDI